MVLRNMTMMLTGEHRHLKLKERNVNTKLLRRKHQHPRLNMLLPLPAHRRFKLSNAQG